MSQKTDTNTVLPVWRYKDFVKSNLPLVCLLTLIFVAMCLVFIVFVSFVPKAQAITAELTQSYVTNTTIQPGALVSLNTDDSKEIVLANQSNSDKLVGVLIGKQNSAIALNSTTQSVQVATSGRAVALVSNINGDIKAGDTLSLSAITGVAGKVVMGSRIVGVAQADFSASSENTTSRTIQDKFGKQRQIALGSIPVVVGIGSKINPTSTLSRGGFLGWFEVLAGKTVSNLRLIICALIAIIMLIIMFIIIFSSIQSTIYGVSRNPFAKVSIFEAFAKVIAMTLCVATVAMVLIYVILRV